MPLPQVTSCALKCYKTWLTKAVIVSFDPLLVGGEDDTIVGTEDMKNTENTKNTKDNNIMSQLIAWRAASSLEFDVNGAIGYFDVLP